MCLKQILYGTSLFVLLACPVMAAQPLAPRGEVSVKGGTDRSLLTTEFWAPLAQQSDRVLYGDIRLMGDNDENREGNLGLGYRQIKNDAVIGVHGWIDRRRTQHNSTFHQLTFGVERLGHIVDARANIYVPLNESRTFATANTGNLTPYLAGSGIFYDTNGLMTETPQYGVDGELGYRIPVWQKQVDAIRIYGGGYYFFRDNTVEVPGARFRTEAQVNKIFSVGARVQYDKPRGTQGFLEATLKFPFSAKRLYQESGIRSRLDESPERDVDIVTSGKVVDTGLHKKIINAVSGQEQRVLYVDNTAAANGDGTKEKPYNTLKTAEANLRDNDILYIHRGDGTTNNMNQGLVINKANVSLIGSGSNFVYDNGRFKAENGSNFSGTILAAAGLAPVLTNSQAPANINEFAAGIGSGVLATGENILISGLTVQGAQGVGIYIRADNKHFNSATVTNVSALNNVNGSGVYAVAMNGGVIDNLTYSYNTSSGNITGLDQAHGLMARADVGSKIGTYLVQNNTVSNNSVLGIVAQSFIGSNAFDSIIIENNNINSINHGVYIAGNGIAKTITIQNNQIVHGAANAGSGVYLVHDNIVTRAVDSVLISNNTINGYNFTANDGGINIGGGSSFNSQNIVITKNNVINNNNGIRLTTKTNAVKAEITDNNISGNSNQGIYVFRAGGDVNAAIRNNTISNNINYGVQFYSDATTTGSLSGLMERNTLVANGTGVFLNNDGASTTPFVVDLGGGSLNSLGLNKIYSSTSQELYVDLVPNNTPTSGNLMARNNWWGVNTGLATGRRTLEGASTIDASGFLTTAP